MKKTIVTIKDQFQITLSALSWFTVDYSEPLGDIGEQVVQGKVGEYSVFFDKDDCSFSFINSAIASSMKPALLKSVTMIEVTKDMLTYDPRLLALALHRLVSASTSLNIGDTLKAGAYDVSDVMLTVLDEDTIQVSLRHESVIDTRSTDDLKNWLE